MPSAGGWPHSLSAGAPFMTSPSSSFESGFPSSPPHFHSQNFRSHYPSHSSPTLGYGPQCVYRCDRFCHNQQAGHQHDHQHVPHQYPMHPHEQLDQPLPSKELPEPASAHHPFASSRSAPRSYNLPPALMNVGLQPPAAHRYYLPPIGLQSSSAQSLSSPYPPGCQSPASAKQDGSMHSIGAPIQQFHSGTNPVNDRDSPSQNPHTSEMSQRIRSPDPLFFGVVPHTRSLLVNQHHRLANGLPPFRLGSLRPGSHFYRYD